MLNPSLRTLALVLCTAILYTAPGAHAAPRKATPEPAFEIPPDAIRVSNYELTTFIFPAAIQGLTASGETVIDGDPVYQANKTQVLLQFGKMKRSGQLVISLVNGEVLNLRVYPVSVPGTMHSINNARKPVKSAENSPSPNAGPNAEDVAILKLLVSNNEPPAGFDPLALPPHARFDKFTIIPLASWSNGSKRLSVFSLVSNNGATAVVSPPQFYRDGITAVMIDGDSVDPSTSPTLFILENETE